MEFQRDPALRALFLHSSVGILITNKDGVILEANPYATQMFGYIGHELSGEKVEILLPLNIRKKHVGYRDRYSLNPEPRSMGLGRELLAVKKNGHQFPVEISLSSFDLDDGLRIVSFVNDITETQKYRQKLEDLVDERTKELSQALVELNNSNVILKEEMRIRKIAEKKAMEALKNEKELSELKTRFVSMASHEFRTPLAGIMTSISLLQRYIAPEFKDKREKHFLRIKSLVRNLTGVLNDFLSLDKLEQGIGRITPEDINIRVLISEIIDELNDANLQKRDVQCLYGAEVSSVYLDKYFLRNILVNLLTNAMKYSDVATMIKIGVKEDEENIIFEITDQGYGIPENDQKHMFERFFRAANVMTIQGTGLGLNIVKRYVDLLNGSISFSSQENIGTVFTVVLPKKINNKNKS